MAEDRAQALLELLINVSREVATALDLRTVLQRLLFAAIQYVGGERSSIVVMDDQASQWMRPLSTENNSMNIPHSNCTRRWNADLQDGWCKIANLRLCRIPAKTNAGCAAPDDSAEKSGAKSAICVPLMARERCGGVDSCASHAQCVWTEHLELMQAIADQASVAVLNARLYTESQRTARVMSALAEGAAAINTSLEIPMCGGASSIKPCRPSS